MWFRRKRLPQNQEFQETQVDVFIATVDGQSHRELLVMPRDLQNFPQLHEERTWRHLAVTNLSDRLLLTAAPIIQAEIAAQGYAILVLSQAPR